MKLLLPGLLRVRPLDERRVVNDIGLAYAFLTDKASVEHNDHQYDSQTTLGEMTAFGRLVARALVADE